MTIQPHWYTSGINHIWPPYTQVGIAPAPLAVARTEGCRIILEDGRELIDGISSWWSAVHGYNNPHLIEAAKKQLDIMPHVMFGGLAHEAAYTLATRLAALTPGRGELSRVFFADSGSIAVEVGLKIALQYWLNVGKPKKDRFICLHHGYHGDTFGVMAVSDPERGMHKAFKRNITHHFVLDVPSGEYSMAEFAETLAAIAPQSAALIIEPLVQGAGGMRFHSPDMLAEIHRLCREHEILFIADEIATGFARTGSMFACDEAAIVPDILCLGKGLTGGVMTLAATLAREEIFQAFVGDDAELALMHGPTFMANPLACAVAGASLDLFQQENRIADALRIEAQMYRELRPLAAHPDVQEVRVKGAIGVVEIKPGVMDIQQMRQRFPELGVWIRPFGNVIYLMPPLVIGEAELRQLTQAVAVALAD